MQNFHRYFFFTSFFAVFFLLAGLFFIPSIYAAITINEIMPHPKKGEKDWIELYKDQDDGVDLSGWIIEDRTSNIIVFPEYTYFATGSSYLQIFLSNRLNNSGDNVKIKKNENTVIDEKSYDNDPGENVSIGRSPDGSSNWGIMETVTANSSNSPLLPTGTPKPSATSKPSRTPIPTKNGDSKDAIVSQKSSLAITLRPYKRASYNNSQDGIESDITGQADERSNIATDSKYILGQATISGYTMTINEADKDEKKSTLVYFLIGGGSMSLAGGIYTSIRKIKGG